VSKRSEWDGRKFKQKKIFWDRIPPRIYLCKCNF
jgi:hypothetical protein